MNRAGSAMVALAIVLTVAATPLLMSSPLKADPGSMPPTVCEMRQRAWCIVQANSVIIDIPGSSSSDPEHTWLIHARDQPDSNLVIFEPRGCRAAASDTVQALTFSHGIAAEDRSWDEMKVRLRTDGTCDLTLRVPVALGNPLEWPFSEGRMNLIACMDDACSQNSPTIADVTNKYRAVRESGEIADINVNAAKLDGRRITATGWLVIDQGKRYIVSQKSGYSVWVKGATCLSLINGSGLDERAGDLNGKRVRMTGTFVADSQRSGPAAIKMCGRTALDLGVGSIDSVMQAL